jgi:opacity protein-like surface antigen
MTRGGKYPRSKWYLGLVIALITVGFLMPAPALALNADLAIGCSILGVITTPLIAYGIWENLPQNQGKERLLKGEFYVGGYMGGVFTPSQDLRYSDGFTLNNGINSVTSGGGSATLSNNKFAPAVVGGFKFGYFCNRFPYMGLEFETSVNKSSVRNGVVSINRPLQGSTQVSVPNDNWINWSTALHLVGRYGFFADKEVPFGRLQPYLGIGPGFVVMYEELDSAKNFAIDVMAGLRYMLTKNVSAFVEYKYSHQFDAEMESHVFILADNTTIARGTAHFNYDSHKWVVGVAYHF